MYNYVISDWFSSIDPRNRGYDLIISNPLYLTDEEYAKAQEEVRSFEPPLALIAGAEIIHIVPEASTDLCNGGWLVLEVGLRLFAWRNINFTRSFWARTLFYYLSFLEKIQEDFLFG